MNVDDLVFKKEDEVIYTDEKTSLAFHLPNNKMITIYHDKDKVGMCKLKKNMSMNKGDVKKVVKRINTDYGLDKKIIEDAFEVCEERLLLRPEPSKQSKDFIETLIDKPDDKKALIRLGKSMQEKYNIIRTDDGKYYYEVDNTFMPLTVGKYYILVNETFGLDSFERLMKDSLTSIRGEQETISNLWEFRDNIYYDADNKTVEEMDMQFTNRKFTYFEIDDLIPYNPDIKLMNDEPTLMEKTLREILIPKNNPEDTTRYYDFLYFLGISLKIGNPLKVIIIYYNEDGNNGKTVLGRINDIIFEEHSFKPRPKDIGDNFFNARADDSNTIIFDEIIPTSFDGKWDELKNYTGSAGGDDRHMHSDKRGKGKGKGTMFILTNSLPNMPLNDKALITRAMIYSLPNIFIDAEEYGENEYPLNYNIFTELEEDYNGQEWLCNAIVKVAQSYKWERQPYLESMQLLVASNKLTEWIVEHLTIAVGGSISNREIRESLEMDNINIEGSDNEKAQLIGYTLQRVFGQELERHRSHGKTVYNLDWIY